MAESGAPDADDGNGPGTGMGDRHASVEILVPTFHHESRQGTVSSAVFNLISTILGGGILSLPFAIRCTGLIPGIAMLMLVAAASDSTLYTLVSCSRRSGAQSFEGVVGVAFGSGAQLLSCLLIFSATFLPLVAYTVLLRDLMSPMLEQYIWDGEQLSQASRNGITAFLVTLSIPACAMQNLSSLSILSILCVLATILLGVVISIRSAECVYERGISRDSVNLWPIDGVWGLLQGLPVLVCSFVCHFNVLPLHGELRRPTRRRLHKVVHFTFIIVTLVYLVVGIAGYAYGACAGTLDYDNILNAFASTDTLVNVGRLGIFFTVLFSFPLLVIPCREMIRVMQIELASSAEMKKAPQEIPEDESLNLVEPLLSADEMYPTRSGDVLEEVKGWRRTLPMTVAILLASTGLAFFVQYVSIIWDLLGSFSNMLVSYSIPCWAYLRIRKYSSERARAGHRKRWCRIILALSFAAIIACSVESIRRLARAEPVMPDD